jgi:murein DD-endopeptidase MepM/ murein hydrolase activator NlpD
MHRAGALLCLAFLLPALQLAGQESYVLQKGDTLYRVSRRFDVPVAVLQAYNRIKDPAQMREGSALNIPAGYTVRKGDTLYGIARGNGLELDELARLNGIGPGATLSVGRRLYLPAGGGSRASPQAKAAPQSAPSPVNTLFWPHPGKREALSGRVTGALIHGKAGDRVLSVSPGRVVWVGPYRGFSRVVLIESENGYTYVYAGNEETLVTVGDRVIQGTEIGLLGKNAHQGVPQLYFLVYRDGVPVDPTQAPRS